MRTWGQINVSIREKVPFKQKTVQKLLPTAVPMTSPEEELFNQRGSLSVIGISLH